MIDWELCHAGDPAEDLAWLCIRSWRFGNDDLPVAGLGELEPFLDAYEAAGGARPDPERLRWWEAMGNVKWAVICARQAHDHLTGARPSAELASLGRRICEPEWDLLELIGRVACRTGPTAPELLDAMAAKLFAEVREWVPRERRFQVLVLANLCAVIARELRARSRAARSPTCGCSASCSGAPVEPHVACPRGGRRRAGDAPSSSPRPSAPASSTTASTRRSAACASTSSRKLEVARPGYAD